VNVGAILGRLSPYKAQEQKIVEDQSTGDIISAITKAHIMYAPEYKKISSFFKGSNPKQTGKKIFDFLKSNVKYVIEPGDKQTVKSPAAILAQGFGDCKHYAGFSGGILQHLGIPFAYRFASYRMLDKQPQHVFVVINPGGSEIWIDPVLNEYNYQKPYTYAKDKKMALYTISGIGATKAEKKAAKKAAGKTLGQKIKKGTKAVLKVAASPVRNAFLLLVKINFANLAVKLSKAWDKAPSKVQQFWESAGGKIQALKTQWEKGQTKPRIFGCGCGRNCGCRYDAQMGVAPAAAATAAAPLLVKVGTLLTSIGIDPAELVKVGKDAVNNLAQDLAKKSLQPKAAKEAAENEAAEQLEETTTTQAPEFTKPASTMGKNMLPLVIGGAAILYFVTRKK
jgi:hypothetical protein